MGIQKKNIIWKRCLAILICFFVAVVVVYVSSFFYAVVVVSIIDIVVVVVCKLECVCLLLTTTTTTTTKQNKLPIYKYIQKHFPSLFSAHVSMPLVFGFYRNNQNKKAHSGNIMKAERRSFPCIFMVLMSVFVLWGYLYSYVLIQH